MAFGQAVEGPLDFLDWLRQRGRDLAPGWRKAGLARSRSMKAWWTSASKGAGCIGRSPENRTLKKPIILFHYARVAKSFATLSSAKQDFGRRRREATQPLRVAIFALERDVIWRCARPAFGARTLTAFGSSERKSVIQGWLHPNAISAFRHSFSWA